MKKFIKNFWVYISLIILVIITLVTLPIWLNPDSNLSGYLFVSIIILMCIAVYKEIKQEKET